MAVDKKTVNKGDNEGSFIAKATAWLKKAGNATANFFKKLWAKVKTVQWNAPVKPVIAWGVIGGVLLVAVAIALLVWL